MIVHPRRAWIFDMDGTLTVPMHDFSALRLALQIPDGVDILDAIDARPAARAERDRRHIAAWEEDIARRAQPQPDAHLLLSSLAAAGCALGVLTRNTALGAQITLQATGLDRYFSPGAVLGRDDAPAKPDPAGILHLLDRWGVAADEAAMVGDWVYDLQAGRRAGAAAVLVRRHGLQPWEHEADLVVESLTALVP